jgi:erythromycin esterase
MTTTAGVREWVGAHARPVVLNGAGIEGLPTVLSSARIVGIASPVRSARELLLATGAVLRALVADAGFRAVMIEGTDPVAAALDRYVRTGDGDPDRLLRGGQGFVRFAEVLAVVRWLRDWAVRHPDDPVSVVHDDGFAAGSLAEVEARLARRDLDWHAVTGQRVVHWGGTAHVVVGDPRTVTPDQTHVNAGGLMRRELGSGYAAVALTAGSGEAPFPVPEPPDDFVESRFGALTGPALVDLGAAGSVAVREWLRRPLRTRMIGPVFDPANAHEARVDAGPIGEAVDVFLHVPRFGPAELLI